MMISTKFNVIAREMGVRAKSARTEVSFFRLLPRGTYLEKFATALQSTSWVSSRVSTLGSTWLRSVQRGIPRRPSAPTARAAPPSAP